MPAFEVSYIKAGASKLWCKMTSFKEGMLQDLTFVLQPF